MKIGRGAPRIAGALTWLRSGQNSAPSDTWAPMNGRPGSAMEATAADHLSPAVGGNQTGAAAATPRTETAPAGDPAASGGVAPAVNANETDARRRTGGNGERDSRRDGAITPGFYRMANHGFEAVVEVLRRGDGSLCFIPLRGHCQSVESVPDATFTRLSGRLV